MIKKMTTMINLNVMNMLAILSYISASVMTAVTLMNSNMFIIWGLLGMTTLISVFIISSSYNQAMIMYYLIQETSSLVLLCTMMTTSLTMSFAVLLIKSGLPPCHFWVTKLMNNLKMYAFILMATAQKLIYSVLLILFTTPPMIIPLLSGVFLTCGQLYSSFNVKTIILLGSNISLCLMLMLSFISSVESIMMIFIYLYFTGMLLTPYHSKTNKPLHLVFIFWLFNYPPLVTLMLKISSMLVSSLNLFSCLVMLMFPMIITPLINILFLTLPAVSTMNFNYKASSVYLTLAFTGLLDILY